MRFLQALEDGMSMDRIIDITAMDPWWVAQLHDLHTTELWLRTQTLKDLTPEDWLQLKRRGFSDAQVLRDCSCRWGGLLCAAASKRKLLRLAGPARSGIGLGFALVAWHVGWPGW